jgi:SAM-dependent methyltransferase
MSGYKSFAYFYDKLIANVDYKAMAAQIDGYVERFGGRRGILLDLACGTGSLSEELARLGYDVIGVDGSCDMLNEALDKKFGSGLNIQYLCQDMRELDMYGTIDVTVCTLDSLNHLPSLEDVKKTVSRVSLFAYPDGMFIFDVNTLYKHREILADNAFIYSLDGLYCGWQNEYDKTDNSVAVYLDFFEQTDSGYERYSESFREIGISEEDMREILVGADFEILAVYDGYSDRELSETSERAVYVCRKANKQDILKGN